MKNLIIKLTILTLIFNIFIISSYAQMKRTPVKTRILFIFDESNSMMATWNGGAKKIDIAKNMLIKMVDSLKNIENLEMALRMYGHQSPVPPQDCSDTRLEVHFSSNNAEKIKNKLKYTKPKGTTPIARSLEECGDDFPNCNNCRNIIILITDGIEACSGDPCKIALTLQSKGITIKPFIIGIGLDVKFKDAFECIGEFYSANDETEFKTVMKKVVEKSLNGTTAQINLLNIKNEPKESNLNLTLFNKNNNTIFRNFIHTMNYKGNPDTLSLPTSIKYKMKVHTIPPVIKDNIVLKEGIHNTIIAKTPQGKLNIIQEHGLELKGTKCIVRKHGSMKTLNVQEVFQPERYLVGNYDIEILSNPRIYLNNIKVTQSKTNIVKIIQPGLVNLYFPSKGYGGVYQITKGDVNLIMNLDNVLRKNIYLQPGHYIAVFRPAGIKVTTLSKTRHFIIRSGHSVNVSLD